MNQQFAFIPLLLLALSACSINTVLQHRTGVEGVVSVDITSVNNQLHLLTGKQQQGQHTLWYQYSNDGGESWSNANKILDNERVAAKMSRGNDAQITAQANNIVVTWTKFEPTARFNSGPMLAARSVDAGKTWHYAATPPDWEPGPHSYIDLAADAQAMHAVWLDSRDGRSELKAVQGLRYARSTDGGLSWQANKTLDALSCSCCWNTIKTDAKGNAYVLYRDKRPSDLAIGVIGVEQKWQGLSRVGAFNWQFEGCPHIGGGFDFQPRQNNPRIHAVAGSGHADHLGIHYLYSDDGGKQWSATTPLGDESALHSDLAAHDNGRVVVVWDMIGQAGLAVFVAESTNRGHNWSAPKQLSTEGARATHPRVVKTAQGFLVVWTETSGKQQIIASKVL